MRKGFTLVEVLVSIFIFVLVFGVSMSTYLLCVNLEKRQSEYLFFESVCLDINQYSTKYLRNWNVEYFGNESNVQYYTNSYERVDSIDKYELSFNYNEAEELIVNVKEYNTTRFIIKDLNYGAYRYA